MEIIRAFKRTDYETILDKGYLFSPTHLIEKSSLKKNIFNFFNKILGTKPQRFSIVMEKDRNLMGVLTYFNFNKNIWVTGPLFVPIDARKQGVGRKLVSAANQMLINKGIFKAFGDVPANNPSKFLHSKLGCDFIDFNFNWNIKKQPNHKLDSDLNDKKSFLILRKKQREDVFSKIMNILSQKFIDFFEITKDNFELPFDVGLRNVSRFFFKKVKFLRCNNSVAILNTILFNSIHHIDVYLDDLNDIDYLFQHILRIENDLKGRLFFQQQIDYEKIQKRLSEKGITSFLNETMIYILK